MEYQNNPLLKKQISIVSHQLKSGAKNPAIKFVELIDGENQKFTFFPKKQDGSPTKAFEYYQSHKSAWDEALIDNFQPKVEIGYEEKEYTYQDSKGQPRVGKRRGIKFFKDIPTPGKPIGDQNQAEYRLPVIDADDIPVVEDDEQRKLIKKKAKQLEEFEDDGVNLPFKSPNIEFPNDDELGY